MDVTARRILIVDDDPPVTVALARALLGDGHAIQTATTGRLALQHFARFEPHTVLLDIELPDIHGHQIARMLRQQAPALHLIAVSAYAAPHDLMLACAAGCDELLGKPFDLAVLRSVLARPPHLRA